jgi:hypothetical protein
VSLFPSWLPVVLVALASFLMLPFAESSAQGDTPAANAQADTSAASAQADTSADTEVGAESSFELPAPGTFLDASGVEQPFTSTYDHWFGQPHGAPRYGFAALENAVFLAIGVSYYWLNSDSNRVDWDRPTISDRFTLGAWRFDNNSNLFNHINHPFGGANFYGAARVNNLSVLEASGYSALTSMVWEFALEWRELVSINDLIFTPISGIAVGEFLFQLGEYATSTPRTRPWHSLGAYTFGLYSTVHKKVYGIADRPVLPTDNLGYSSAFWHRFYVEGEYVSVANSGLVSKLYGVHASAALVAIPGFGRPGTFGLTFSNGNFTEGDLDIAISPDGGFDTDLFFSATLYGKYRQSYALLSEDGDVGGHASLLAFKTAFRFSDHSFADRRDQVAVAHAGGPSGRVWLQRGPWRTNFDLGATADFAAIRSLAFEEYRIGRDVSGVKSVLIDKNYQFHLGVSARARLEIEYKGFGLGARGAMGVYRSLQGYDRKEENVTDDVAGRERVYEYEGFVRSPIPLTDFELRLGLSRFGRSSTIEDFNLRRWDTRGSVSVGAVF